MKHLVIGCGEVGSALRSILACDGDDERLGIQPAEQSYDVLHICFRHSPEFNAVVLAKREQYSAAFVVIHSTVPIGTSEALNALHSPVRGRHPHLEESLRTFVKFVGGSNPEPIVEELKLVGIPAQAVASSRDTEAGKLLDLMQFGAMVLLEKEIHAFCATNGIDFEVAYRMFNEEYNHGYTALGNPHLIRPVLRHVDGPIGGHCVAQNMTMLGTESAQRIIEFNRAVSPALFPK